MKNIAQKLVSVFALVAVTGCLVPERFSASIKVKPDGSYTYKYDGTAAHVMAVAAMQKQGSLSAKDEAGLKKEAQKAAKSPGVRKISYTGNGRYEVSIDQDLKPGQQASTLKVFSVTQGKDGVFTIAPTNMRPKDRDQLKALNIKINGKADVYLPENAKVINHNASSTPGLFSKAYAWKIGSMGEQPSIRFTLGN